MSKVLYNDQIVERDHLIDIEDRAYQFGDGIYEVIGVYNGNLFAMKEHMERLERSAREISLKLPYDIADLEKKLLELVSLNKTDEGIIYLQVSRGTAERWHEFPAANIPAVTVAYTRAEERDMDIEDNGATAILTEDIRWLRCDIKTLNLLPNVLAKQKAVEHGAVEAILHRDETVTEASSSNVFIVKDNELYTHPATQLILNGITRMKVLEICKKLDLTVHEETYTVDDLLQADEVFVTATKSDVIPILKIDNHTVGNGSPGKVTQTIIQEFRAVIDALDKESRQSIRK